MAVSDGRVAEGADRVPEKVRIDEVDVITRTGSAGQFVRAGEAVCYYRRAWFALESRGEDGERIVDAGSAVGLVGTAAAVAYETGAGGAGGARGQDVGAVDAAEAKAGVVAGLASSVEVGAELAGRSVVPISGVAESATRPIAANLAVGHASGASTGP